MRTWVQVPRALCREQGTMTRALGGSLGESWGQRGFPGLPLLLEHPHYGGHHHGDVGWGLSLSASDTMDAALSVPSLLACDKQDLRPE